jgi:hypothetical protein
MPTVYLSNMSNMHKYSEAAQYGAIRPLTAGNYPIFKTVRLLEEIVDGLVESTDEDYLLLSGSSVIAGLCVAVWLQKHRECKLLLFDRKAGESGKYVVRVVTRDDIVLNIEKAKDRAAYRESA